MRQLFLHQRIYASPARFPSCCRHHRSPKVLDPLIQGVLDGCFSARSELQVKEAEKACGWSRMLKRLKRQKPEIKLRHTPMLTKTDEIPILIKPNSKTHLFLVTKVKRSGRKGRSNDATYQNQTIRDGILFPTLQIFEVHDIHNSEVISQVRECERLRRGVLVIF